LEFSIKTILENTEDNIFRADIIVHGFFNDDGLPDIFYTNGYGLPPTSVGPYQFWLNSTKNSSGYLLLELEGTRANRDAIGAQIELYDMEEKLLGYRELGSNFGRGQNTHKIHFGLGDKQGPFNLKIRWPGSSELQQLLVNRNSSYHVLQN
jgi:ASPIC and UnbV